VEVPRLPDGLWLMAVHGNRRLCLRRVLDAVHYLCRTGRQWRALSVSDVPRLDGGVLLFGVAQE